MKIIGWALVVAPIGAFLWFAVDYALRHGL